ncbi:MAG: hypothetical protein RLZZ241_1078 [Bacteroidota bacterium]|jgi:glucose/arabinose dehydrogenase
MKTILRNLFRYVLLIFGPFLIFNSCKSENNSGDQIDSNSASTYAWDELSIQHGMELFNRNCASCHNFVNAEIGPALSGVTHQVSKAWLIQFIKNPTEVIKAGDSRAVDLFNRYKLYMPAFEKLEGQDMEHLLAFIHQFSEAEKKNTSGRTGGIVNPIPESIPESDKLLKLETWLTLPASSETPLLARINKLYGQKSIKSGSTFVADQRGTLYEIWDGRPRAYLDVKAKFPNFIDVPGYGSGFGSFAFHPDFDQNGLLYTTHTEPAKSAAATFALPDTITAALQWVLTEWQTENPKNSEFLGKKRELLRADMVTHVHGFQEITFNPLAKPGDSDYGKLYLGIGDGGAALGGYPELCDNLGQIWGSVLRIDPAGTNSKNGRYGIPEDNPFVANPNTVGEIWCRGFRNPHRITWDTGGSGFMFISNIGQHSIEEVNIGQKGGDYGWPSREGTFLFDVHANSELVYPVDESNATFINPALQYDHDEGNAVSGGYAYSGTRVPGLRGSYLFGDIPRGTVFIASISDMNQNKTGQMYRLSLEIDGKKTSLGALSKDARVDLRFGSDADGELYLLTKNDGKVYKVVGLVN